jgi:predicted nucleic acid-binding protein
MGNISAVCIDSCVIISFLKGCTDRTSSDSDHIKGLFADIQDGKIHVLFPTLLRVELLECNLTKQVIDDFEKLTGLENFDEIPLNHHIGKLASEIRSFYKSENLKSQSVPILALADCVFIATAIEENCPKLLTYDGDREPPSKPRKLLSLKSPIAGKYVLDIQKPFSASLGGLFSSISGPTPSKT